MGRWVPGWARFFVDTKTDNAHLLRLASVTPALAWLGEEPMVTISDAGFRARVKVDFSSAGKSEFDQTFLATVSGVQMQDIVLVDAEQLRARVLGTLGVGMHELVLVLRPKSSNPWPAQAKNHQVQSRPASRDVGARPICFAERNLRLLCW